ncbi:hypothetical protein E4N72_03975 [Treponema vincentii]|nr:hypothetical protein E4N72_03975 [Treponema vincentii]
MISPKPAENPAVAMKLPIQARINLTISICLSFKAISIAQFRCPTNPMPAPPKLHSHFCAVPLSKVFQSLPLVFSNTQHRVYIQGLLVYNRRFRDTLFRFFNNNIKEFLNFQPRVVSR